MSSQSEARRQERGLEQEVREPREVRARWLRHYGLQKRREFATSEAFSYWKKNELNLQARG